MPDRPEAFDVEALVREIQLYLAVVAAARERARGESRVERDPGRRDNRREER